MIIPYRFGEKVIGVPFKIVVHRESPNVMNLVDLIINIVNKKEVSRELKETDKVYLAYVHLDYSKVKIVLTKEKVQEINMNGGVIKAGTHIGYLGVKGNAKGIPSPHLHFEVQIIESSGKIKLNPAKFIELNPYDTKDQDDASKINWKPLPKSNE